MPDQTPPAADLAGVVDRLSAIDAKLTPGPWDVWRERTDTRDAAISELMEQVNSTEPFAGAVFLLNADGKCPATTGCGPTSQANAEGIAELRTLLPTLLAALSAPVASGEGIPAGMKPWHGGDSAPEDWDGGVVLLADGTYWQEDPEDGPIYWGRDFSETGCIEPGSVVAYTPKALAHRVGGDASGLGDLRESLSRIASEGFSQDLLIHRDEASALVDLIDAAQAAPAPVAERRQCSICTAIVASYPEGLCCHCQELPWPHAPGDQSAEG